MKTITLDWLRKQRACQDQVRIFEAEWGEEAELTRENLERAAMLRIDLSWLAEQILTAPALAEYERLRYAAWTQLERERDSARAQLERERDAAWAQHDRVTAATRAQYEHVRDAALVDALAEASMEKATEPAL